MKHNLKPKPPTAATYQIPQRVLELIWLERLRQKQLFREGKIHHACDSPIVDDDRKLRVAVEELGEAAREIELLEQVTKGRTESEASFRARYNKRRVFLREEVVQVAAVAVAWLEALESPS